MGKTPSNGDVALLVVIALAGGVVVVWQATYPNLILVGHVACEAIKIAGIISIALLVGRILARKSSST